MSEEATKIVIESPVLNNPDKAFENQIMMNESHIDRFGIFCTSTDKYDDQCWSKFARNSQGFCIGYNIKGLLQGNVSVKPIRYTSDNLQKLNWRDLFNFIDREKFDSNFDKLMDIKYFTKNKEFEFEKEVRWLKEIGVDQKRAFQVKTSYIEEVLIGKNMSLDDEIRLRKIA